MEENELMLEKELDQLKTQHRELDNKIHMSDQQDQFLVLRLKKEKLKLRDLIIGIEAKLYPDIIA